MRFDVFTLFPEAFDWYLTQVHIKAARELGHEFALTNYRDHTPLNHLQVDDTPFGGGAGMVLRIDVVCAAFEAAFGVDAERVRDTRRVVELTPKGRQLDDALASELAAGGDLVLLCGRYEGIDERVTHLVTDRVSVGPYVLSGGEIAAMATLDAVTRKLPGVDQQPRERRERVARAGARGRGGVPALHAAGRVPRLGGARGAAQRAPRRDRALARGAGRKAVRYLFVACAGRGFCAVRLALLD